MNGVVYLRLIKLLNSHKFIFGCQNQHCDGERGSALLDVVFLEIESGSNICGISSKFLLVLLRNRFVSGLIYFPPKYHKKKN